MEILAGIILVGGVAAVCFRVISHELGSFVDDIMPDDDENDE